MKTAYGFSRRGPDRVAEELATVLTKKTSFEFKALFLIVHANLRARNAASGGEEMLRLRAYEKLQNLVQGGIVKKVGKTYRGVPAAIESFFATAAELNERFASGNHSRAPLNAPIPETPPPSPVSKAPAAKAPAAKAPAAKAPVAKAPATKAAGSKPPVAKAPAAKASVAKAASASVAKAPAPPKAAAAKRAKVAAR